MGNPERYEEERDDASEADSVEGLADPQIREEVLEALATHADLDMSDVEVYVRYGRVTLGGVVDSRDAKRAATETAEQCAGVIAVRNEIRVETDVDLSDAGWDGTERRTGGRGSSQGRTDRGS
jgi:osmotically-inducible protein OsmY